MINDLAQEMAEPALSPLPDYSNLLSVKDNVILVTGASSGLGASFSRFLAKQGAKVVLAARRLDKVEALVAVSSTSTAF